MSERKSYKDLEMVVFDMAGTTLQIGGQIPVALKEGFLGEGIELTDEEIHSIRGLSKIEAIRNLLEKHLGNPTEDLIHKIHQIFLQKLEMMFDREEVRLIPGAEETFSWLKAKNLLIALNTGFERKYALMILERVGWSDIADTLVCGDEVSEGRPAPDLILESMKRLDCRNPSRVAAVGDTQSDLNAAAEAKVGLAVGVLTGAHNEDQLKLCPHHLIIPGVGDLPKYLS